MSPPQEPTSAALLAIRQALLRIHDEDAAIPIMSPMTMRVIARLYRFRVGWLATPWAIVEGVRWASHGWDRKDVKAVSISYQHVSGKDQSSSFEDVLYIWGQLDLIESALDAAGDAASNAGTGGPSLASTRAEFEAAVDALLLYCLHDRRADDRLLTEAQAAFADYRRPLDEATEPGRPLKVLKVFAARPDDELRRRCVQLWRLWLEHQRAEGGIQ
jgi:hypothetical protein